MKVIIYLIFLRQLPIELSFIEISAHIIKFINN